MHCAPAPATPVLLQVERDSARTRKAFKHEGILDASEASVLAGRRARSPAGLRHCRCEDYDCTCDRRCSCAILGDATGRIAGNASSTVLGPTARTAAAMTADMSVGYLFRCGCGFDVSAASPEFAAMDCACTGATEAQGSRGCRCSRRCVCDDDADAEASAAPP